MTLHHRLFVYTFIGCITWYPLYASGYDNTSEDNSHSRIIKKIDIIEAEETAAGFRELEKLWLIDYEMSDEDVRKSWRERLYIPDTNDSLPVETAEQKSEREKREEALANDFWQKEGEIYHSINPKLDKSEKKVYENFLLDHRYTSVATLKFVQQLVHSDKKIEFMEQLSQYDDDKFENICNQRVGAEASRFLMMYYLDTYNKYAADHGTEHNPNKDCQYLLTQTYKHMTYHPADGFDDMECAVTHISWNVEKQLQGIHLWYVDNPKIYQKVGHAPFILFARIGYDILNCTTYGHIHSDSDLQYYLKTRQFRVFSLHLLKNENQKQHIWVHHHLRIQVRITENGKLTVGILKEAIYQNKQWKTALLKINKCNEVYKIASSTGIDHCDDPEYITFIVPARHAKHQPGFWSPNLSQSMKNQLMNEAHGYIESHYNDFDKVTRIDKPIKLDHKEKRSESRAKKKKK